MKTSTIFAFLLLAAGTSSGQAQYCLGHDFVLITGAPYAAEETYEQVQTQAGRTYTIRQSCKLFRDAQGRERIEALVPTRLTGVRPAPADELVIEIRDPVSGFRYTLDTETKVVHRYSLADSFQSLKRKPQPGATTFTESLGTRLMEGVSAEGQLETTTAPISIGAKRGNLRSSVETWRSPELQIVLLSKSIFGETRITNISRSEPSPDLFRLPPDYTLVEFAIPSVAPRPAIVGSRPSTNPKLLNAKLADATLIEH